MEKVMIVDAGARGHALALAYLESGADQVLVAPGNGGMEGDFINTGSTRGREIYVDGRASLTDPDSILEVAKSWKPTFVDVAQDDAIQKGTVDLLEKNGFRTFGATREAGQIEWDKEWSRNFMRKYNLPIPECNAFTIDNLKMAEAYAKDLLERHDEVFLKAAGLYAGKGVIPATDERSLKEALAGMAKMGDASKVFMVEEGMQGEEFSYYAIVDGENFLTFEFSSTCYKWT
jgi:phosphoribosylamine--glycine ligase